MDSDRKGLTDVLRQAAEHQGTALVEIYQNCNIFNDGAFDLLKDPATGTQWSSRSSTASRWSSAPTAPRAWCRTSSAACGSPRPTRSSADEIVVHDAHRENPAYAFALSRLSTQDLRYTPMGVFRSIQKPTYDAMMADQLEVARTDEPADLDALLAGNDNWVVERLISGGVTRSSWSSRRRCRW